MIVCCKLRGMVDSQYKAAYDAAIAELNNLIQVRDNLETQREKVDSRIAQVRDGLHGLAMLANQGSPFETHPDLFPDFLDPDVGITEAVRQVLRGGYDYMSPVAVRDKLIELGIDKAKYKNLLAVVHQILRRLDSNEAESRTLEGKTTYRWRRESKTTPHFFGGGTA